MPRKRTHEEFISLLYAKNKDIDILGQYINSSSHIHSRCKVCGYEWDPVAGKLLRGGGCPVCKHGMQYTEENFLTKLKEINKNIDVISKFVNGKTHVRCKCKIDGYEWDVVPYNLINKRTGCPLCAGKAPYTHETFINKMAKINPDISFKSEFCGVSNHVLCHCNICGYEWDGMPSHLFYGVGCPDCAGTRMKTHDEFIAEMKVLRPEVNVLETYSGNKKKLLCECNVCGHRWRGVALSLLRGHSGCCECSSSLGESRIFNYLKTHGIEYVPQKSFDECRDKQKLPFDCFVPSLNTIIEYDGQQHDHPVQFGGMTKEDSVKAFEKTKKHDNIKNNFCIENNIKLIRIPYTDFDRIEEILDKQLL